MRSEIPTSRTRNHVTNGAEVEAELLLRLLQVVVVRFGRGGGESRGRPLPRFMAAPTADAGVYCPAATAAVIGTDAEIGVAFSGRIRLPSGPYFLGLPLFFPTFTTGLATGYPPPPTTPAATTAVA